MTIHEAQDILAVLEGQEIERQLTHWMLCQRRQDIYYWAGLAVANHFVP